MNELRKFDTQLRFITKTDRISEMLDIASYRYCTLFHLALSLSMQTSLIVLNNSIIGMPSNELKKLIAWLKQHDDVHYLQIIAVERSNNKFSTDKFGQLIYCKPDEIKIAVNR